MYIYIYIYIYISRSPEAASASLEPRGEKQIYTTNIYTPTEQLLYRQISIPSGPKTPQQNNCYGNGHLLRDKYSYTTTNKCLQCLIKTMYTVFQIIGVYV